MDTRVFSVYNLARGALLNSKLKLADSAHQPLKLLDQLISGLGLGADSGLWLLPVTSAPLIPRVFPFDFAYLDKKHRVLHAVEIGPGIEFPPYSPEVASALLLPAGKLLSSKTLSGDCLVICPAEELEAALAAARTNASPDSTISVAPEKAPAPKSTRKRPSSTTADRDLAPAIAHPALENAASAQPAPALVAAIPSEKVTVSRNSAKTSAKTPFEQAILDAIAKADNPETQTFELRRTGLEIPNAPPAAEPSAPSRSDPSRPAISSTAVAVERMRNVPPAVVELHPDPEDLFSNWVVTPSVAPAWVTENSLDSPDLRMAHEHHPATLKPEPALPSAPNAAPKTSPGIRKASESESGVTSNTTKPVGQASASQPVPVSSRGPEKLLTAPTKSPAPGIGIPQISTATTFSAVPYAMWQVSTPTAVPLGSPAKSPSKSNSATAAVPESVRPENGKATVSSPGELAGPVSAPSSQSPTARESTRSALPQPTVPARRSTDRPAETSSRMTPAQFRSSVQERLERLQQTHSHDFNPVQAEPSAQPIQSSNETPSPLDSGSAPHVWPSSSEPQSVAVKSGPVLAKNASPDAKASAPPPPVPKPQTSAMRVETAVATEPPRTTLKSKFKKWLNPTPAPSDRRRAARRYVPGMVAHYFTGGAPKPHSVADISMTGFYLLTEDRWMPGTMIQMTLQKPCAKGERKQSITVLSRIVRRGSDGVATEFVMPGTLDPYSHEVPASQATDKFALARFL